MAVELRHKFCLSSTMWYV